jgi:TolB-like protein
MSLFAELNRRNVTRVAIFYVVTAWLVLQVIDVVAPILGLSDAIAKGVLMLFAVGLIPALIFSWVYEMTPEGLKKEHEVDRDTSITNQTAKKLDIAVIGLLVPVLGLLAFQQFGGGIPETQQDIAPVVESQAVADPTEADEVMTEALANSIAVLPFANRSAREEDIFFTDGIHDDLLTQLAKIASLEVISRTSVMSYRDTELSIPEIAGKLGVANILEGGVQRAGDQVRINVQLIEAGSDKHLWAETYDRMMTTDNLFSIQSEITREIISALKATLTSEEASRIDSKPTENLEAYQEYLWGKQLLPQRTVDAITRGKDHFERAVALDDQFAEALVGLANAKHLMFEYAGWSFEEAINAADLLVDKALELKPNLGVAYTVQGELRRHQNRFEESEIAFQRAVELMPSDSRTHMWYGLLQGQQGRYDGAIRSFGRAHQLDPMSPVAHLNYAITPFRAGKDEDTLAELARINTLHPNFPSAYGTESWVRWNQGDTVGFLRAALKAYELDPESVRIGWMCQAYLDLNTPGLAQNCMELDATGAATRGRFGQVYLELIAGNRDAAAARLRQLVPAMRNRSPGTILYFASLVGDNELAMRMAREHFAEWVTSVSPEVDPFDTEEAVDVAQALAGSGQDQQAQRLLETALKVTEGLSRNRGMNAYGHADAKAHALLGNTDAALTALEDIAEVEYLSGWQTLSFDPAFDSIRDDLRFSAVMSQLEKLAEQKRQEAEQEGLL